MTLAYAPTRLFVFTAAASFGAVAAALLAQYQFHMQPCPWCILQRIIFILIGAFSLCAWALPTLPRKVLAFAWAVLAASGIAAALYQHFVAAPSSSCALTLADRIISGAGLDVMLPAIFAVRASCADAAVNVLGLPFEFWSAALFGVLGLIGLRVLRLPLTQAKP